MPTHGATRPHARTHTHGAISTYTYVHEVWALGTVMKDREGYYASRAASVEVEELKEGFK